MNNKSKKNILLFVNQLLLLVLFVTLFIRSFIFVSRILKEFMQPTEGYYPEIQSCKQFDNLKKDQEALLQYRSMGIKCD